MLRYLIDECCTLDLVDVAVARGQQAAHARDLGLLGRGDPALVALAQDRGFVVVTNNRDDYVRIYARLELHEGLVVIMPNVSKAAQTVLFGQALDVIAGAGEDIVNMLVEVSANGTVMMTPLAREIV